MAEWLRLHCEDELGVKEKARMLCFFDVEAANYGATVSYRFIS